MKKNRTREERKRRIVYITEIVISVLMIVLVAVSFVLACDEESPKTAEDYLQEICASNDQAARVMDLYAEWEGEYRVVEAHIEWAES